MIAPRSLTVQEINRPEQIGAWRDDWRSLLDQTPSASFFQSCEWLETYWRFFGEGQKLRLLVVRDGDRPVGIVPLTVIREETRIGRVRTLTYPLHDWGSFYGPIGADPAMLLAAALDYIRQSPRDWDLFDLRWIDRDADQAATPNALQRAGFNARPAVWAQTALVDTRTSWKEYLDSRSPKFRSTLRRYEKKMASLGSVSFERHRPAANPTGDPRYDLFEICVDIAEKSWQGASTTGTTLSHPKVREYLRATHAVAAAAGALEVNLLCVSGQPIGFCYNYYRGGVSFGLRKGNLPEYSRDGASMVLTARVLEDSFARRDAYYDMGPGSIDVKDRWMTKLVDIYRYTHYPLAAPKAQVLRLKHWWRGKQAMPAAVPPTAIEVEN